MTLGIGTEAAHVHFLGIFVSNFRYSVFAVYVLCDLITPFFPNLRLPSYIYVHFCRLMTFPYDEPDKFTGVNCILSFN